MAQAIPVVDFRRQGLLLEWYALSASWLACDNPPRHVHGIALIRAAQPSICIYGRDGALHLQVGRDQYELSNELPRLRFVRDMRCFGLRRCFLIESSRGEVLTRHTYWSDQGDSFFRWLTARTEDPAWRAANGRRWSDGIEPAALRAS